MELTDVEEILKPYLDEHNLKLYEIAWVKEFGYTVLRISVDNSEGIDVDTLALVNDYLSERLDAYENELPEYMLEVCSPGAEKPLKTKEEVLENVGKYIHLKTKDETIEGDLLAFENDVLTIKINIKGRMKNIQINYEDIKKIRLAVKF